MTNYSARLKGETPRGYNIEDGHGIRQTASQRGKDHDEWTEAGFEFSDWNKRTYSWSAECPEFLVLFVGLNVIDGKLQECLAARSVDHEVLFPNHTSPYDIAARLDYETRKIMEDPERVPDWQPCDEIDIDAFMSDLSVAA